MDRRDVDMDGVEVDPLTDLAGLFMASGPEEFWRALVVYPGRPTSDSWLAVQLFRRHHAEGTPGALTTALLLCTDRRWDRCTACLIAGIVDAALLGEDDLDEMSAQFLGRRSSSGRGPTDHRAEVDRDEWHRLMPRALRAPFGKTGKTRPLAHATRGVSGIAFERSHGFRGPAGSGALVGRWTKPTGPQAMGAPG